MGRRVLAAVAALVAALVGFVAVLAYAHGADQRARAGQQTVSVYVAQKVVPAGTTAAAAVAQGLIARTQAVATGVPEGVLKQVDDATSRLVATTDIAAGEFVLASRFGPTAQAQKAIDVPAGQVALSLSLADPARVGSFVTPGSRIVIYDTLAAHSGGKATHAVLTDVLVIGVGGAVLSPGQGSQAQTPQQQSTSMLVTVAVPPASALRLVHAAQGGGSLYAGLLGTGSQVDTRATVDDKTLFPH